MATGTLVFGFQTQIKNVLDPVDATDAVTKEYVDNAISGGGGGNLGAKGNNFDVQFNNLGNLSGSDTFTFDYGNTILKLSGNGTANLGNLVTANYFTGNFVNGSSNIAIINNGNINLSSAGTANVLTISNTGIFANNANITNNITSNTLTLNAVTDSTSTITGALIVSGGAGISGNIYSNGIVTSSANVTGTTLTINTGNIVVNSTSAGLFNDGISDVSIGLSGNVTLGNTSANVTSNGLLLAANISSNGTANLNVVNANSLSLGNIVSGLSNINVTTDTIIDQFPIATYRTAKYLITAKNNDGYQSVETLLIHDNMLSYITIYGEITTATPGIDIVTMSSNIASGNVCLYATGGNTGTVVNFIATYVTD